MVLGKFNELNNRKDLSFLTQPIYGDTIFIEYFEPKIINIEPKIHINSIAHVFSSKFFNSISNNTFRNNSTSGAMSSGACEVDINCADGTEWGDEASSVALIYCPDGQNFYTCSGVLINDINSDGHPYFLSANHCATQSLSNIMTNSDVQDSLYKWVFIFNYYNSTCGDTTTATYQIESLPYVATSLLGATLVSRDQNNNQEDYLLLDLSIAFASTEIPVNVFAGWAVCYSGWDIASQSSANKEYVCIHHPNGDVKKISTSDNAITPGIIAPGGYQDFWLVSWDVDAHNNALHGVTERGSSGSPLYNNNHRIIGQLTAGLSSCTNPTAKDAFGMFQNSWADGGFAKYLRASGNGGATSVDTYCPAYGLIILPGGSTNPGNPGGGTPTGGTVFGANPSDGFSLNHYFDDGMGSTSGDRINICPGVAPTIYLNDPINNTVPSSSIFIQTAANSYNLVIPFDYYSTSCFGSYDYCDCPNVCVPVSCNCYKKRQKYWLSVWDGCDAYDNCTTEHGGWQYYYYPTGYPLGDASQGLNTIDVGAQVGYNFTPGKYYRITLATGPTADVNSPGAFSPGNKLIYIPNYDEDLSNQTLTTNIYTAASHINMANTIINSAQNVTTDAGVEIHIQNGSSIKNGSQFHGYINTSLPCYNGLRLAADSNHIDTIRKHISNAAPPRTDPSDHHPKSNLNDGFVPPDISSKSQLLINPYYADNYLSPNPTNGSVTINYSTVENDAISINIYSSLGIKVANLFDNKLHKKGQNKTDFDTEFLQEGVYFVEITGNAGTRLLKLNVIR